MSGDTKSLPDGFPADPSISFNPGRTGVASLPLLSEDSEAWDRSLAKWTLSTIGATGPPGELDALPTNYILHREIGRGGFGEVWEGWQSSLGRLIAIKRIREDLYAKHDTLEHQLALQRLFRQEALTAAVLDHPNILPIHDLGLDEEGRPLIAMKLVQGQPWSDLIIEDFPRLSAAEFLARHIPILLSAAQAVAFAHSRGIVHRDFKPSQVMVGAYGEVLLMDWGLAVCFDEESLVSNTSLLRTEVAPDLESASNPAGTAALMAPEQTLSTAKFIGPWTDVFLLGGTLYFLLTGKLPYGGKDSGQAFYRASLGKYPPPREATVNRWMPEDLLGLIEDSMRADHQERLGSAHEFVERLQDHLSGTTRHRQSQELVEDARGELLSLGEDYRAHESILTSLRQAGDLWPQNPDLGPLREELFVHYSKMALRHGDLMLARLQAERLPEGERRAELLLRIDEEVTKRRRRATLRKLAVGTVIVLVLVMIAGSLLFSNRLREERDEARASRDQAREARSKSEDLASFMVNDLRAELQPLGRIDLLDDAALKLMDYYATLNHDGMSEEELLRAQAGLVNIGILFVDSQAQLDIARQALEAAIELNEKIYAERQETDWAYYLSYSRELYSRVLARQGELGQAISQLGEAIGLLEGVVERFPKEATTMKGYLVDYYTRLSQFLLRAGDMEAAKEAAGNATKFAEDYAASNPTDGRAVLRPVYARHAMATLYDRTGKLEEAGELIAKNIEALESLLVERPDYVPYQVNLSRSYANLGDNYYAREDLDSAKAVFDKRISLLEHMMEGDSSNTNWTRDVSSALRDIAKVQIREDKLDEAEKSLRDALELSDDLVERDGSNTEWLLIRAFLYADFGRVEGKRKNHEVAEEWLQKMEDELRKLYELDRDNKRFEVSYADSMTLRAEAMLARGKKEEALAKAMEAYELLLPQMEANSEDNRTRFPFGNSARVIATILRELGRDEEAAMYQAQVPDDLPITSRSEED